MRKAKEGENNKDKPAQSNIQSLQSGLQSGSQEPSQEHHQIDLENKKMLSKLGRIKRMELSRSF
jgi:hypothetical protein